jgi:ATP-dependent Clp protease ATP-binding subunit ClpA
MRSTAAPLAQRRRCLSSGGGGSGGGGGGGGEYQARPPWVAPEAVPVGEALKKYGNDLTQRAHDGKLDPVIGRDDEIRRTVEVLARRRKVREQRLALPQMRLLVF